MSQAMRRREFLQFTVAGTVLGMGVPGAFALSAERGTTLISPGCRRSKVKIARLYMGIPGSHWPTPTLNLEEEMRSYQAAFEGMNDQFADVEFVVDRLVTSPGEVEAVKDKLAAADGILVIHLSMGTTAIVKAILAAGRPTALFAAPYSGHEWTGLGAIQKQDQGAQLECFLTSDRTQLAVAVRPFRAIHHLRAAKILNVSTTPRAQFAAAIKTKFGTELKQVGLQQVVDTYQAIPEADAQAETDRWLQGATKVVEPSKDDVFRACKLALAFEKMLEQEEATVLTVDCYGTMWDKTIKLPAYPCVGFSRLNSMGLGGICESDLQCAMTHILFQGLSGRPGFISDPTMDESARAIILAHCLGTAKMDGPSQPAAPYKLRTVMERQEGVVPQVSMRVGQKVTQAILVGTERLLYFTGETIDAPDLPRGCRTKITVKLDGDAERLWKNWSAGLHRVTCYGNLAKDLQRFCRYQKIELVNEAV